MNMYIYRFAYMSVCIYVCMYVYEEGGGVKGGSGKGTP
jgi:hypothetical protein